MPIGPILGELGKRTMSASDRLTACIVTMGRPDCALRLVRSIRASYPSMRILLAEQENADGTSSAELFTAAGAEVIALPHDCGVCVARNRLMAEVSTPYFVLCDDDFVWSAETKFDAPLDILDHNETVAIVGGMLFQLHSDEMSRAHPRHWEHYLLLDPARRLLRLLPLSRSMPSFVLGRLHTAYLVDAVMNFAVVRTRSASHGLQWDERYKSNGEHEDFYLNLKLNTSLRVAYSPEMVAYHQPIKSDAYLAFRGRTDGWIRFAQKWDVDAVQDGDLWLDLATGRFVDAPRTFSEVEVLRTKTTAPLKDIPSDLAQDASWPPSQAAGENDGTEALRQRIYDLEGRLKALLSSKSWRLTAPIRAVTGRIRKWIIVR